MKLQKRKGYQEFKDWEGSKPDVFPMSKEHYYMFLSLINGYCFQDNKLYIRGKVILNLE